MERQMVKGKYATVSLVLRNDCEYVAKTNDKEKLIQNKSTFLTLFNEISILRALNHESAIKLYEVYEDRNNIHLIMEYLKGGELFMKINKNSNFSERDACEIMKELLIAVEYIHSNIIIHRDLKPESIILVYCSDLETIALTNSK